MEEKVIVKECLVHAPRSSVWEAFTTTEGATKFFAPEANIELRLDGPYELYFMEDGEPGSRGSEGCKVLAYVPEEMLSFTWNAPPEYPEVRRERTYVVLRFSDAGERRTKVSLYHGGWREGGQWDAVYSYFVRAWDIVFGRLKEYSDSL